MAKRRRPTTAATNKRPRRARSSSRRPSAARGAKAARPPSPRSCSAWAWSPPRRRTPDTRRSPDPLAAPHRYVQIVKKNLLQAGVVGPGPGAAGRRLGRVMNDHRFTRWAARSSSAAARARARRDRTTVRRAGADFSRFIPASELNRVNAAGRAGRPSFPARSPTRCGRRCVPRRKPGGSSTRASARRLLAAGYARDFDELEPTAPPGPPAAAGAVAVGGSCGRLRTRPRPERSREVDGRGRRARAPGSHRWMSAGGHRTRGPLTVACPAGARRAASRRAGDERPLEASVAPRRRDNTT